MVTKCVQIGKNQKIVLCVVMILHNEQHYWLFHTVMAGVIVYRKYLC